MKHAFILIPVFLTGCASALRTERKPAAQNSSQSFSYHCELGVIGGPGSNGIKLGETNFDPASTAPALIYPPDAPRNRDNGYPSSNAKLAYVELDINRQVCIVVQSDSSTLHKKTYACADAGSDISLADAVSEWVTNCKVIR